MHTALDSIFCLGVRKAKHWPYFLLIMAFAAILVPQPSFAFGLGDIFGVGGSIINTIGGAFGTAIAAVAIGIFSGMLGVSAILLGWAIDPFFVRYSYTGMEGIVGIGWPVVRDLANMLIVVALIAIALGTALRINEYEAKKTLPRLLGVALLINFTPVILGIIIDATNIVMNFFLEGFVGAEAVKNVFTSFFNGLTTKNAFSPAFWIELAVLFIFTIIATILFLLFAFLFIMRRIAIWILVILSPLAFAAYILPSTRKFFNTWWQQFMQWAIVGVSASFFLWLGNQMIALSGQADFSADVGGVGGYLQETFNQVFAYGVALIFLIFGFFMALQTSAIGASGVIGMAQKTVKGGAAGAWRTRQVEQAKGRAAAGGAAALRFAGRGVAGVSRLTKLPETAVGKMAERLPSKIGRPLGWAAKAPRRLVATPFTGGFEQAIGFGAGALESYAAGKRKVSLETLLGKGYESLTAKERNAKLDSLGKSDLVVATHGLQEKGISVPKSIKAKAFAVMESISSGDITVYKKEMEGVMNALVDKVTEKMKVAVETAGLSGDEFKKKTEEWVKKIGDYATTFGVGRDAAAAILHARDIKPDNIKNMDKDIMQSDVIRHASMMWNSQQLAQAGRNFGKVFVDQFMDEANQRGHEWFERNNSPVLKYLSRNAAEQLGYAAPIRRGTPGAPNLPPASPPPPPGGAGGTAAPTGPIPGGPTPGGGPIRPGPRRSPSGTPGPIRYRRPGP